MSEKYQERAKGVFNALRVAEEDKFLNRYIDWLHEERSAFGCYTEMYSKLSTAIEYAIHFRDNREEI